MASSNGFIHVALNENDVPGAALPFADVSSHSILQLKRWLQCRGLKQSGNKCELIKRIQEAIQTGRDVYIDVNIDNRKWYEQKKMQSSSTINAAQPPVPPITGWKIFPSENKIPQYFNEGHLHHYFFESGYSDQTSTLDATTSKPIQRGKLYFTSGHIQELMDVTARGHYFIKAKVMASYKIDTFYPVHITLVENTGYILDASCECVASSMGRCSHVAGTLYAILDYINLNKTAHVADISVTSKACMWNRGRQRKRSPGKICDTSYTSGSKNKKPIINLIDFNPIKGESSLDMQNNVNSLITTIKTNGLQNCMFDSILSYVYDDYGLSNDRRAILVKLRVMLLDSIAVARASNEDTIGRHPTALTEQQGTEDWFQQRKLRITASEAKSFANCKNDFAVKRLLYEKLWSTSSLETCAMKYGKDHEEFAKKDYLLFKQKAVPGFYIFNTGLWSHTDMSELAVSPDGLFVDPSIQSASDPTAKFGLLEVKCPFLLRDVDPIDFEKHLAPSQKNAFCLQRDSDGVASLKLTHSYYYQIQMQLGVMNLVYCDFVVWSTKGIFCQRIELDLEFWEHLKLKLIRFHHTRLCPEYFEMRTVKNLLPFYLDI